VNSDEWGPPKTCQQGSCTCSECVEHGSVVEVWEGMDTYLASWREDGSGLVWYHSEPPLRRPVRFRTNEDGTVVPVDRGKRREKLVNDLSGLLPIVNSAKRGRPGVPPARVVQMVDSFRGGEGMTVEEALRKAATVLGLDYETVRAIYRADDRSRTFLTHRRWSRQSPMSVTHELDVSPKDVAELVRRRMRRHNLTADEASLQVGAEHGWAFDTVVGAFRRSQLSDGSDGQPL
jgi:hypothetical protein